MAATTPAADWSQAPSDILWNIIKRLPLADHIRFGGVCVPWRSTLAEKRCGPAPQVPWLMLPGDRNGANDGTVRFFSLTEKDKEYRMSLPKIRKFRCIGSSEGFLIYTDQYSELHMLDPISGAHVDLPSITTLPDILYVSRDSQGRINSYVFPDGYPGGTIDFYVRSRYYYFQKAILSPGSTIESYTVVAISSYRSQNIAFARAGDKAWSVIHIPGGYFHDAVFHNQLLIALVHEHTWSPNAVTINLNRLSAPILSFEGKEGFVTPEDLESCYLRYLVVLSSSGELLLVSRYVYVSLTNYKIHETLKVSLHKLDSSRQKWVVTKSIGDHAIFLGHGHSVSISTIDFPEIKPNCIYFTDNSFDLYPRSVRLDMGVYDIEDGTMKPYGPPDSILNWPPPIWFTPNIMGNPTGNY